MPPRGCPKGSPKATGRDEGTYHPRTEADHGRMLGFRIDMASVKTVLNIAGLFRGKVRLVNPRLSEEANSEARGKKSRLGCQVEEKVLPESSELVVGLGGAGEGGGGSIQAPGLSVQRQAPLRPLKVDLGREGLAELVHPGGSHYLVLAQRLQKFSC